MSVRNGFVLLLALSALLFLAACGSNGNSVSIPVAPPSGNFSNSNLNGTYVFSVLGSDFNGAPYAIVGTINADGSGGNGRGTITGGTIDINDSETTPAPGLSIATGGFYSIGIDGRGTFTIGTTTANPFGANMTFDVVLSSSSHGLVTEFDDNGTGSGTIDLQTANTAPTGTYAFSLSGISALTSTEIIPAAGVGAFTLDNGAITASAADFNNNDFATTNQALSGNVALGPSTTPSTVLGTPLGTLTFDVYAIDASHFKLIETDTTGPVLAGDAFSQTSTSISGTLTFTLAGNYVGNIAAAGGFMSTDGTATINPSTEDYNNGGGPSSSPVSFSGSYSSTGSLIPGRSVLSLTTFFGGSSYAAYPSSGGLLLLEIDGLGTMSGVAYNQSTTTFGTTSQGYGLNLTGTNPGIGAGAVEVDDIAEFTASAAASGAGTLSSGIIDENFEPGGGPTLGLALSAGTYQALDSTGRYGLAVTAGNSSISTLNGGLGLTFYTVDGTTFPFIEIDTSTGQVATGVIVLQNPTAAAAAAASRTQMFVPPPLLRSHIVRQSKKKAN
jgi:hypothetical protein